MQIGSFALRWIGIATGLCASAFASGTTYIVGPTPDPRVDFTSIQAAIDAASHEDVIIVLSGVYAPIYIDRKAITIQAATDAHVVIEGCGQNAVEIVKTTSDQNVILRQIEITASGAHGIVVSGCCGTVWAQDCRVMTSSNAVTSISASPAVRTHHSDRVILVRVSSHGSPAAPGRRSAPLYSTPSLASLNADVYAYDCNFHGGAGIEIGGVVLPGAPAVEFEGGRFFSARGQIDGGAGVMLPPPQGSTCSAIVGDGVGIWLKSLEPEVDLLETMVVAGGGAVGSCGSLPTNPHKIDSGTLTVIPGFTRLIGADSIVQASSRVSLTFQGKHKDFAFIGYSTATVETFDAGKKGCLFLKSPFTFALVGQIPHGGVLPLLAIVPPLPPGAEVQRLYFQGAFFDASDFGFYYTNPEPVTIVK